MTPSAEERTPGDIVRTTQPEESAFDRWARMANDTSIVDPALFAEYDVKRGLRDVNGKGVLAGLTRIGDVVGTTLEGDHLIPAPGELLYRGIEIKELVDGFSAEGRLGFEETAYLLLFGELPSADELKLFEERLAMQRVLPQHFVHDAILRLPSPDIMNAVARGVLAMYVLDGNPDETSVRNVLWQSLQLIACLPVLAVYAYQAHVHHFHNQSLVIHAPLTELSAAENILHMLRSDSTYTPLEAKLLDMTLVLQAEHGGGNNSTFTTHVVSSTATDTYSAVAASLGSLKGPKHGGANLKVVQMFEELKSTVTDWDDDEQIKHYFARVLSKDAFDRSGLVYGMGHPVYSISDPRTSILRYYAEKLAVEKGLEDEFALHARVERIAADSINSSRRVYKGVSANVDFYSGFVYTMLDIPPELFTPLFAVSRIVGWSAHRIEQLANGGKIMRPAYKSVSPLADYVPLSER